MTRSETNDSLQAGSFFLPNQSYGEGFNAYYDLLREVREDPRAFAALFETQ